MTKAWEPNTYALLKQIEKEKEEEGWERPFGERALGWLEAFAKETPFHPQYWATPEEKRELIHLQYLEDYARMLGIEEPRKWAEELYLAEPKEELAWRAAPPEEDVLPLPTLPYVSPGERLTPGERMVGEWGPITGVFGMAGIPPAIRGWQAAAQLPKPAMVATRTGLAPFVAAEAIPGAALKYGIVIPVTQGIPAAGRKALQLALDTGLDKWIATQGRIHPQYRSRFANWVVNNREWLVEQATNNWTKRMATMRGQPTEKVAQAAVDDTIKQAEPQLLKAALTKELPQGATAKLPTGITPKPTIIEKVPLAGTPKAELSPVTQNWLGKRTVEQGLSAINQQINKWGLIHTPQAAKRLIKLNPIQEELEKASAPRGEVYLPKEPMATNAQKVRAHQIALNKGLMKSPTEVSNQYRILAKAMIGKRSMMEMTQREANIFIKALEGVVTRAGKPPKIPVTSEIITEEFAKKIPLLQEIGVKEKVRPTRQVFEKMGLRREIWEPSFEAENATYQDLMAFREEFNPIARFVGRGSERDARLFRAIEHPEEMANLSPEERVIAEWGKKRYDSWANKLKLPTGKRRQNYITHTFEEAIAQDLAAKHPIDPDLIRAMDFASPKTVFNPYLQKRLGQTMGLKESFIDSINAYESRALRTFHYEPLIQRIRVYEKYLPPNSARYLRDFIARITSRPLNADRELNQTLREFAGAVEKLPGGRQLGEQLTKGNAGGLAAYNYTSLLYFLWLGFKPTSAIRNLSQHFLALSEIGPIHFAEGIGLRATAEGQAALKKSKVLTSRKQAYMPGIDTSFASKWMDRIRETSLKMFRWADRQNVSDSFLMGYSEARSLGLPEEYCIMRGDEVAADTQYLYTRLAGASWSQAPLGRVLSPLTTWPENWLELMTKWTAGRRSYVYQEYEAATGQTIKRMPWNTRRKALLLYLTLVGAAYATQHTTKFRASEYTGWTSIRYLQDIAGGEFPGLELPRGFAEVIGGAMTGDMRSLKTGWSRVRPDRAMGIVRQLENVADGKTDWLSLFIYLNPEKAGEAEELRPLKPLEPLTPLRPR